MGVIDSILGRKDGGDPGMMDMGGGQGFPPYGQGFDPNLMPLLNSPNTNNAQIAQFTTDNTEVVEKFKEGLRGFRIIKTYDIKEKREKTETETFGTPAMNDRGINELCRDLELYLSKPFLLSNFPEQDRARIDTMMKIIWKTISTKLIVNANAYALDKTRRPSIVRNMVFIIYMNVMRSYEDGERPRLYGSHKTIQQISQVNQPAPQKKTGIFGW